MALTKATLIDLNANELILDLDADTSITADTDDTIDFKIAGSDEIKMTSTALTPAVADGSALGTAALEWADLFLADAAVISLGADQDVTLTHVHNEGLLLNSTMKLEFNDASQFVQGSSATVLSIGATDEIDLTATLIDINGNLDVSGTVTIGNAEISEAELETIDGITAGTVIASKALVADANIDITGGRNITISGELDAATLDISGNADIDGTLEADAITINGTAIGSIYGVLAGSSSIVTVGAVNAGSITSGFTSIDVGAGAITTTGTGTIGNLVVDDVAVNGKVITMTGSSGDTFTTTVGTNGATTLTTVDTAAAAANITITADGTAELAGTTVTLNSAGGVTLDADNGTVTFADAGSSLGTITSSGYSGTAALATTVTITDNESTNENNVITFVAGAAAAGGNVGLESDGNLTYNPSTGTLSCTNIVTSGTHTVTDSVTMTASNAVVFEGSTADNYETTLTTIDATGDRTISLPNVSGTIPVLAAASATAGRIDAGNDVVAFSSSDIRFKKNRMPIQDALFKIQHYEWGT